MEFSSSIDGVFGQPDNDDAGSAECMRELVSSLRNYRPHIFRFLLASFGDPELAKALTQRCIETAFFKWNENRDHSHTRNLLMRMAVNLQRRHWFKQQLCFRRKKNVKTSGLAHLNEWLPSNQQTIKDEIQTREQIGHVWNVVCQLSNRQKIVFLLYWVEEMTSIEIAEIADRHQWTVEAALSEALNRIRAAMHEPPQPVARQDSIRVTERQVLTVQHGMKRHPGEGQRRAETEQGS
jgi:RNA polymerase sigma-70 factor (ECF subfamily)